MPERSQHSWPEPDDKSVVTEMLKNLDSEHWTKCRNFVQRMIRIRYSGLPEHFTEEAVQITMISVHGGLRRFRFDSRLTTWLTVIIQRRVIDVLRKQAPIDEWEVPPEDSSDNHEDESDIFKTKVSRTPEDEYLTHEKLEEALEVIEKFIRTHAKPERNREILQSVLIEGHSCEEASKILGIPAPVVSYVVRSARDYLTGTDEA